MPYITTAAVKEIRNELKARFPKFKFSVVRRDGMAVDVSIMRGPIDFGNSNNQSVNKYWLEQHWGHNPEAFQFLKEVVSIVGREQRIISRDTDYGDWPNYYFDISIGKWDRPYELQK
jgi:hypothetical protein